MAKQNQPVTFFSPEKVWKAWFLRPELTSEGHCGRWVWCPCTKGQKGVLDFTSNPLIVDIDADPTESSPITHRHPL